MFNILLNKIKNSKIIKNSMWMVLATVIQMIISLFVNIFVARYLGAENYGILNYGLSFVNFFLGVCNLGLGSIVIKFLVNEKDNQGQVLGTCILLRIFASIISILSILLLVYVLRGNDQIIIITTLLQSISLIFESFTIINLWYQYKLASKYTAIITFIAYIIMALYKIFLLVTKSSLVWFALSHSVSSIVTAILLYVVYKNQKSPKFSFSLAKGKAILKESYHFIISSLMVAIYAQTDKIMIGSMIDDISAVGYYSVATTIVSLWAFIPSAVNSSFQPTILETKKVSEEEYLKKLKQLYSIIIWLCLFYTLGILLFGKLVVLILYGKEFLPALPSLQIAIFGITFSYIGVVREFWLVCENKQKYAKWFALVGVITNIILNVILIPIFGITGAAIATTMTQFMTGIIAPLFFKETREAFKHVICGFVFKFK